MNRRSYLAAAAATSLAGCLGGGDEDDPEPPDEGTVDWGEDGYEDPVEGPSEWETFEDFGDLSGWEAAAGELSRVDEDPHAGSQSALVEGDADDDQVRIVRELSPPVDFSGMAPGLAVATDGTAPALIQLLTAGGGRIDFRSHTGGNRSLVRTNFGIANVVGDPDLGAVTEIQIGTWAGEDPVQLWVDDLHFVPRPEPGRVVVQFDGGYETVHEEGLPVLSEYDYPATAFVPTERVREDADHEGDRLTEDQLADLAEAGWTIGSYAAHGLALTDPGGRDPADEVADARAWLEDNGFDDGARYISFPGDRYDDEVLELAGDHHDLGFAGGFPAQGAAANRLLWSQLADPDVEEATRALDLTADLGGVTVLRYFDLGDGARERLEGALARVRDLEAVGRLEVVSTPDLADLTLG